MRRDLGLQRFVFAGHRWLGVFCGADKVCMPARVTIPQHGRLSCCRVRFATPRARGAVDPGFARWSPKEALGLG
jgi:hypothetical protein